MTLLRVQDDIPRVYVRPESRSVLFSRNPRFDSELDGKRLPAYAYSMICFKEGGNFFRQFGITFETPFGTYVYEGILVGYFADVVPMGQPLKQRVPPPHVNSLSRTVFTEPFGKITSWQVGNIVSYAGENK